MKRVRIQTDGTQLLTRIYDAESGEEVLATKVTITIGVQEPTMAWASLEGGGVMSAEVVAIEPPS